ncbi:MAG: hypothetical protein GC160_06635 [Acidobacteria bacterium]|nr:hypothetical protein [Acidobacteriota bacterium]
MTITDVTATRDLASRTATSAKDGEKAGRNREIAEAVRKINEGGGLGANSELQFSVDEGTGQPLIRVVDRITEEVITQFPPESTLRTAEVLKSLRPGDRIA